MWTIGNFERALWQKWHLKILEFPLSKFRFTWLIKLLPAIFYLCSVEILIFLHKKI